MYCIKQLTKLPWFITNHYSCCNLTKEVFSIRLHNLPILFCFYILKNKFLPPVYHFSSSDCIIKNHSYVTNKLSCSRHYWISIYKIHKWAATEGSRQMRISSFVIFLSLKLQKITQFNLFPKNVWIFLQNLLQRGTKSYLC